MIEEHLTFGLLIYMALSCFMLGGLVVLHNHRMRVNWAFLALSVNLGLWGIGVLAIIHAGAIETKVAWIRNTFVVSTFFPVTFYLFMGLFPRGAFSGSRKYFLFNLLLAPCLIVGAFTPWYLTEAHALAEGGLRISYGPVFLVYVIQCVTMFVVMHVTLFLKLRQALGIERRQIQYVLFGIFTSVLAGSVTNIILPALNIYELQRYGPICFVLMLSIFAYAMVRYHLLEMRVLISNTLANITVTTFVVAIFIAVMTLGRLFVQGPYQRIQIIPTVFSALIIAIAIQAVRERVQRILNNTLLKRRYETGHLFAKISRYSARLAQLDQLLDNVGHEIQTTIGTRLVRILLRDERIPEILVIKYSTNRKEIDEIVQQHAPLMDYLETHDAPILLEELIRTRANDTSTRIASHLAELDAYLCVPLKVKEILIGILLLGQKESHDMYGEQDKMAFTALAGPLAAAIENSRLYHQLENVNMHLSRVLANIREGVIAVDETGKITTVNQSAIRMLGQIDVGQPCDTLAPEMRRLLETTLREQQAIDDYETEVVGPDGDPIPVVLSSTCINSPTSPRSGAMAMIFDLTQVKYLEANIMRAERLSSIGTLAAGMAHEIKNPLVSIKTFTQLLLSRYQDEDFRTTFSEVIPQEVERIDGIVTRLLDFARPKPVDFSGQDLQKIIRDVLSLIENQTRSSRIRVRTAFPRDPLIVNGDEQQLHQLFLNLFLNAIEAMEGRADSTLTIAARIDRMHTRNTGPSTRIMVGCVKIMVEDNGEGISDENMAHLFTPFFTTKTEGSGLGLSVVHGIIQEHGGDINVESTPGEGTTFSLTLPMAEELASITQPSE